jgi:hypothetical protein
VSSGMAFFGGWGAGATFVIPTLSQKSAKGWGSRQFSPRPHAFPQLLAELGTGW